MRNTKVDELATEVTEATEPTVQQTAVKVRFTVIKFFNEETNAIDSVRLIGKMGSIECKKHIQSLNKANVMISKANEDEEFLVDTIALYALKSA